MSMKATLPLLSFKYSLGTVEQLQEKGHRNIRHSKKQGDVSIPDIQLQVGVR